MRNAPSRHLSLLPVLILAVACGGGGRQPLAIGEAAPEFSLPRLGGGELDSVALAGDMVIVNFWATWCRPCLHEIPVFKELDAGGVRVVGIALDERGESAVAPFVERQGLEYTILLGDQEVFQRFDGLTIPYTLVLDGEGRVVSYYRGPVTREALLEDIGRVRQGA